MNAWNYKHVPKSFSYRWLFNVRTHAMFRLIFKLYDVAIIAFTTESLFQDKVFYYSVYDLESPFIN
jgi:hypothetical protein